MDIDRKARTLVVACRDFGMNLQETAMVLDRARKIVEREQRRRGMDNRILHLIMAIDNLTEGRENNFGI